MLRGVILGLGSNTGDSRAALNAALNELSTVLDNFRAASFYNTAAMDVTDQPDFLNTACIGDFRKGARELLDLVQKIEADHGRDRSRETRRGPRTLDIDILYAGNFSFHDEALEIPHPRLHQRLFALIPLLEIAPDAAHPVLGSLERIARALPDQGVRKC